MRSVKAIICALSLAVPGQASAIIVTYEYSLNTPTFPDPPFAPLNAILQGAGPTIEGTISFDTEKRFVGAGLDFYSVSDGGVSHTGELNLLGFDSNASLLVNFHDSLDPGLLSFWSLALGSGPTRILQDFEIQFADNRTAAFCNDLGNALRCGGVNDVFEHVPISDLNLTRVPEPATLALMGLGIAGISCQRRKQLTA